MITPEKLGTSMTSIGPGIVDIAAVIKSDTLYEELCTVLEAEPGEWRAADHYMIRYLLGLLAGKSNFDLEDEDDFELLTEKENVDIEAGSGGVNVLSALSYSARKNSIYMGAVGTDSRGNLSPLAQLFAQRVERTGMHMLPLESQGVNPLVFVFSHPDFPDKITAMHAGVGAEIRHLPNFATQSGVTHIEAYDLRHDPAASVLDDLITSDRAKIALGLSNESILEGEFREKILGYLEQGLIFCVAGNVQEFNKLLGRPEVDPESDDTLMTTDFDFGKLAKYVLMTQGAQGLIGYEDGKVYYQRPFKQTEVVNTSGAGDTALGVLLSGYLTAIRKNETFKFSMALKEAAYYSSLITRTLKSRFVDGRDNIEPDTGHHDS